MNFDDKGNDYFLHNFKDNGQDETNTPQASADASEEAAGSSATQPKTNGFTFPEAENNAGGNDGSGSKPAVKKRKRHFWRWFFFILFVILGVAVYIRYFVPYAIESRTTGYVTRVEKRGIIFKTFEGEMISQSQLTDTARIYSRDFYFSIPDDSLARVIQSYEGTGKPVTLTCKRYFGTLPWRGSAKVIATAVDN